MFGLLQTKLMMELMIVTIITAETVDLDGLS
jgi:hypothetical protein